MRALKKSEIIDALRPQLIGHSPEVFSNISTDTRKIQPGDFFIALKGESFDGHEFIEKAISCGASGLLVHSFKEEWHQFSNKVGFFVVSDTLLALQALSRYFRDHSPSRIVGITGSNGKTTSKEFTAAILKENFQVHYSKGSFNNHWGVPFSLLSEPPNTQVSVIEMGMNHAGEISRLCEIANPDIVVCSMVGRAHIENFGTVEKIAQAKNEIYQHSKDSAIRIFNLDNEHTKSMHEQALRKQGWAKPYITFSTQKESADVYLKVVGNSESGLQVSGHIRGEKGSQSVLIFGEHNITNLLVAASVALALGMKPEKIWKAMAYCKSTWGRNQILKTKRQALIVFDGYNANPDSMHALLENVGVIKNSGKKYGFFAQMLELGDQANDLHFELGEKVGKAGFEKVWFYGQSATSFASGFAKEKRNNLVISDTYKESLASELASVLNRGDVVFIKGSRGMKLERVVQACDPLDFSLNKEE